MNKYKNGDLFAIEIENSPMKGLYRIKGIPLCMVEEHILDKLTKCKEIHEIEELETMKQKAFEEGMNATWELVKKMYLPEKYGGLSLETLMDIFKEDTFIDDLEGIFIHFSAKEAKDMIERYEEKKKINEGDVVEILEERAVVLAIDRDIASVYVVDNVDGKVQEVPLHQLKKVGYSVDVLQVLGEACDIAQSEIAIEASIKTMTAAAHKAAHGFAKISKEVVKKGSAE